MTSAFWDKTTRFSLAHWKSLCLAVGENPDFCTQQQVAKGSDEGAELWKLLLAWDAGRPTGRKPFSTRRWAKHWGQLERAGRGETQKPRSPGDQKSDLFIHHATDLAGTFYRARILAHSLQLPPPQPWRGEVIPLIVTCRFKGICASLLEYKYLISLFCPSGLFACLGVRVLSSGEKGWGEGELANVAGGNCFF